MRLISLLATCLALLLPHGAAAAEKRAVNDSKADPRPSFLFAIADDWSYPHAGIYGDTVVKTPTFDRIAGEGALFTEGVLHGSDVLGIARIDSHRAVAAPVESGADLWGTLPARFAVYPDVLEKAGYHVGFMGKGWAPGALGDRKRNPAGKAFKTFDDFIKTVPPGEPFCFWFGSHDPHRPYVRDSGEKSGMKIADVTVPPYLPDTPEVRGDILDYYFAVERYDRDTGHIVKVLEDAGRLDNTMVVMTSDNGWPFPRAKANAYEWSAHMPLAIRWPAKVKAGEKINDLVSLVDIAPTFLQAAGADAHEMPDMSGQSFLGVLTGDSSIKVAPRAMVFFERERHANVRKGNLSYPIRAVRTDKYLYVLNLRPDLWPAGDPQMWKAVGPFGDIDPGPTKSFILDHRNEAPFAEFFRLACAKRLGEEMFDLEKDPNGIRDVAGVTEYQQTQQKLAADLHAWMKSTNDPRAEAGGAYDAFDHYPYSGDSKPMPASRPAEGKK